MKRLFLLLAVIALTVVAPVSARLTPPPNQPSYRPHDETSGNPPRDPCPGWGIDDGGTCTIYIF